MPLYSARLTLLRIRECYYVSVRTSKRRGTHMHTTGWFWLRNYHKNRVTNSFSVAAPAVGGCLDRMPRFSLRREHATLSLADQHPTLCPLSGLNRLDPSVPVRSSREVWPGRPQPVRPGRWVPSPRCKPSPAWPGLASTPGLFMKFRRKTLLRSGPPGGRGGCASKGPRGATLGKRAMQSKTAGRGPRFRGITRTFFPR